MDTAQVTGLYPSIACSCQIVVSIVSIALLNWHLSIRTSASMYDSCQAVSSAAQLSVRIYRSCQLVSLMSVCIYHSCTLEPLCLHHSCQSLDLCLPGHPVRGREEQRQEDLRRLHPPGRRDYGAGSLRCLQGYQVLPQLLKAN